MNKKKWIYIGILIVVIAIVSIASFSYAFLTRVDEQHGKINIVAGTLDYKIESDNLENTSITLEASESKEIEITIKSLNTIDSKYQLYTNNVENVDIRYTDEEDPGVGTIDSNGTKTVKVVLENNSDTDKTITFGVQGGFEDKTLTLEDNRLAVVLGDELCVSGTTYNFDYTGNIQEFTPKCSGAYKLETWGAQGGNTNNNGIGGYGGYGVGVTDLQKNTPIYITVGGQGKKAEAQAKVYYGGYNGGGPAQYLSGADCGNYVGSGGGATHIAKVTGTLLNLESNVNDILIVSGGGGGANYTNTGGHGGGFKGNDGIGDSGYATGGTQTAGGIDRNGWNAMFGGGSGANYAVGSIEDGTFFCGSGGGGGYYGGGRGFFNASTSSGGGSGYIGNALLTNKKMVCYNCATSTATNTYTVSNTCVNATATSDCSKTGNGYARITYLGKMKVTFNANGGSVTETIRKVEYGNTIGELPTPILDGKSFVGWYLDSEFTTPVDSTYKAENNITLYALWGTKIDLNLGNRTQGYPSNTAYDITTKRSYTMNTYVVGLAFDNYYSPNAVASSSITNNTITMNSSSGYGIGLPVQLSNGSYVLSANVTLPSAQHAILSAVKYTSDGSSTYTNTSKQGSGKITLTFTIDSTTSYQVLVFTNNGTRIDTIYQNINLYKLD